MELFKAGPLPLESGATAWRRLGNMFKKTCQAGEIIVLEGRSLVFS
jgi:hypothetical protein